jgi:ubiquinone/menaquinone biosynthesis C-methylase UbiE
MQKSYKKHKLSFDEHYCKSGTDGWEKMNKDTTLTPIIRKRIVDFINSNIDPFNRMRILDVGCGFGDILMYIQDVFKEFNPILTGCDISDVMIKSAKNKTVGISFNASLAEQLPYKNNSFDYILCTEVLEHVISPSQTITELVRVLKPDGTILITTPHSKWLDAWGWYKFPINQIRWLRNKLSRKGEYTTLVKDEPLNATLLADIIIQNNVQIMSHGFMSLHSPYYGFLPKFTRKAQVKLYKSVEGKVKDQLHCTQTLVGKVKK